MPTFTEHCTAHGVVPGTILNSVLDENSAVVVSVEEETLYAPARVKTRLLWPRDIPHDVTDACLPDWTVKC
jgi:hypothetical protein